VVAGIDSQLVQATQRGHRPDWSPHIACRRLRRRRSGARTPTATAMCTRAVSSCWRCWRGIISSPRPPTSSFARTAQPAAGQAFSSRDVSGAASTAHFPRHGDSTCSHGLGDLAIAIGVMELAAPSCCRLGLLAGGHRVLLAGAVDLPRSQCWSTHSSHLARVATRSFASHSRT